MQILVHDRKVIDYCEGGYVSMDTTVVCPSKNQSFEDCIIVTVDSVPEDIDTIPYEYIEGKFIKVCSKLYCNAYEEFVNNTGMSSLYIEVPPSLYKSGNVVNIQYPERLADDGEVYKLYINGERFTLKDNEGNKMLDGESDNIAYTGWWFTNFSKGQLVSFLLDIENKTAYWCNPSNSINTITFRILADDWVWDEETECYYYADYISNKYSLALRDISVGLRETSTKEQYLAAAEAMLRCTGAGSEEVLKDLPEGYLESSSIRIDCYGIKPSISLFLEVQILPGGGYCEL